MTNYKYTNKEETEVMKYTGGSITKDGKGWSEFQQYLIDGGQVDPWKTDQELFDEAVDTKLQELEAERNARTDAAVGTGSGRKKDKTISRSVKLLRREVKGQATPAELAELDMMEALDDFLDALENEHDTAAAWLQEENRTLEEIQIYDVVNSPNWPVQ